MKAAVGLAVAIAVPVESGGPGGIGGGSSAGIGELSAFHELQIGGKKYRVGYRVDK